MSLLDEAIKVGKQIEGKNQRLASLNKAIADAEKVLGERQRELIKMERESAQMIKAEQTTWDNARRDQQVDLSHRENDVSVRESALKSFPSRVKALDDRDVAVDKREKDAEILWQNAKQAEIDWHTRNIELDAKAADINKMKAKG